MIVGLYGVSLCLLMPSVLCIDGFGELGEPTTSLLSSLRFLGRYSRHVAMVISCFPIMLRGKCCERPCIADCAKDQIYVF